MFKFMELKLFCLAMGVPVAESVIIDVLCKVTSAHTHLLVLIYSDHRDTHSGL